MNFNISKKTAFGFIILLGMVSLFADITYEGGRSIIGSYLALLGASGTIVGIVVGFGELVGYALRLVFGYIADKTKRYWLITIVGYTINLFAIPLLGLVGRLEIAIFLIILERIGKAIRTPSRDMLLSSATKEFGYGRGFGLHEALDQIGAILGPLVMAVVLYFKSEYRIAFALLFIPALLALMVLIKAKFFYPQPMFLEKISVFSDTKGLTKTFWIYLVGMIFVAAGYVDFPLIAYHFKKVSLIPDNLIPTFYSIAMGTDALAAILLGRLFDRKGFSILVISVFISLFFVPLVFLKKSYLVLCGMLLWGIGIGAQESIMRAAIANMISIDKRAFAYGVFSAFYGLFWFLGSAVAGKFYDISIFALVIFSVLMQLFSIPFFILAKNQLKK
ncbi:MAG: MFS transporter [Candidatus Omnitrophica bacterium]|nr:MFS transporter [Candidatus Omnitrophota bacterium]